MEAAGNIRTEEMITGVEDEGEIKTGEMKEIIRDTTAEGGGNAAIKNE